MDLDIRHDLDRDPGRTFTVFDADRELARLVSHLVEIETHGRRSPELHGAEKASDERQAVLLGGAAQDFEGGIDRIVGNGKQDVHFLVDQDL